MGAETMCRRKGKHSKLRAANAGCLLWAANAQGQSATHKAGTQTTKRNKGEMDEQQPTEAVQQQHVQQQQQQQQHKVTWAAVVAQKAPPQQDIGPCRGHRSVLQGGTRRHRDARTRK
ncbi:hypothetical protein ERJ75_000923000 [Trypanosoma vivax]|nr:hypothetical protein ERJ75_000923000 [Trypanosoma vivax]